MVLVIDDQSMVWYMFDTVAIALWLWFGNNQSLKFKKSILNMFQYDQFTGYNNTKQHPNENSENLRMHSNLKIKLKINVFSKKVTKVKTLHMICEAVA